MKILFLSNLFPPNQIGGYEVLCSQVAAAFAARGHEVHVLTSCYGGKISRAPSMTISQGLRLLCGETIYQPFAKGYVRGQVIAGDNRIVTRNVLERIRPDVIFSWNLHGLSKDYFHMLEVTGVPVVCMLTDNWLASMMTPDFVGEYFKHQVYNDRKEKPSISGGAAQRLDCAAIFGARYMQLLYEQAGLIFADFTIIHNGVDISPPFARTRLPRHDFVNGTEGPVRLLFAGRIVRLKGVHTTIEALGELKQRSASVSHLMTLTIVGDSADEEYMAYLRTLAEQLGVTRQIDFLPPVPEAELPDLFDAHDIFIFPSLYEPFSLTLIHALASGIPTVSSSAGGNVEIVSDRQTGLLFTPGDAHELAGAIRHLVTEKALREKLSSTGREVASHFTITRMIGQMEAYLTQHARAR